MNVKNVAGLALLGAAALAVLPSDRAAAEEYVYRAYGTEFKFTGEAATGIGIRAEDADPDLLPDKNARLIGLEGRSPTGGGANDDDGDLNFRSGDAYAGGVRAKLNFEVTHDDVKAFASIRGWYDYILNNDDFAWGNLPNGLTRGTLSDRGASDLAKFQGVQLWDAYIAYAFDVDQARVTLKGGNQKLPWGIPTTFRGGIGGLNPTDYSAVFRPGAPTDEYEIPFPAIFASSALTPSLSVEGFYQFDFVSSQTPACGTLFSAVDPAPSGCNFLFLTPPFLSDRAALASNSFFVRREYGEAAATSDDGQGGGALKYKLSEVGTTLGLYAAQYHNREPKGAIRKGEGPSGTLADTGFLNAPTSPTFSVVYPEDVAMYGFTSQTQLPATQTAIDFEVSYRPNAPIALNGTDVYRAMTSPALATPIREDFDALASGERYNAYDRFDMTQIQMAATQPLPGVLGAAGIKLGAEVAGRFTGDLPDPETGQRYGRSSIFNSPEAASCAGAAGNEALRCSTDGYATDFAWGYRLRVGLLYREVMEGLDLTPFLFFGHDVSGWSDDTSFSEGRMQAALGLRAELKKNYWSEIAWRPNWGGDYNVYQDRDVVTFAGGMRF